MKYKILTWKTDNIVNEQYLRELLFDYEVDYVLQNSNTFFEGLLPIEQQKQQIKNALVKDMDYIVDTLESDWNIRVEKMESEVN